MPIMQPHATQARKSDDRDDVIIHEVVFHPRTLSFPRPYLTRCREHFVLILETYGWVGGEKGDLGRFDILACG